LPIFTIACRSS